jgi:MHS family proline/betaine transporter-like MFS transporter
MIKTKTKSKQVITSCFLAACLEMYDFAIFGLLASVIHKKYFTFMSSDNSLIISYALFSVGFICRPIGAMIFGHIGDRYGRKLALVSSVSMMGIASLSMCLMPSYESIGIASCYMIATARIIQGLSLGGEFSGGLIYAVEHVGNRLSGFVGSIVVAGCSVGILTATIVSYIVKSSIVPDYAWRFAFLLGFGLSILGYFVRKELTETPEFKKIRSNNSNKTPLLTGLRKYKLEAFATLAIGATAGVNIYYIIIFLPTYLKNTLGMELSHLPTVTTICLLLFSPLCGWLSDKYGKSRVLVTGAALSSVYALIMLPLILSNPTVLSISLLIAIHAILFSTQNGVMNVFAVEIFPPKYRYSCNAFCHSLGIGVIGGTSPMVATWITENFNDPTFVLGLYVCMVTLLAGVGIALTSLKRRKIKKLDKLTIGNEIVINSGNSKIVPESIAA